MTTVSWPLLVMAILIFILGFLFDKLISHFKKPKPTPSTVTPPIKPIYQVVENHTLEVVLERGKVFNFRDTILNIPADLSITVMATVRDVTVIAMNGWELPEPIVTTPDKGISFQSNCWHEWFSIKCDFNNHQISFDGAATHVENVTVVINISTEYYK